MKTQPTTPEQREERVKLYAKVCPKCGRQVEPHKDHNLGFSYTVGCSHGRTGRGVMEMVKWEQIEVIPLTAHRREVEAARAERMRLARELGEAQGRLEASEWPGVVDGWKDRAEQAEAALRGLGEEIARTLKDHYLAGVECGDHTEAGKDGHDRASCSCSLVDLGWQPSIGEAVDSWIAHFMEVLDGCTCHSIEGIGDPCPVHSSLANRIDQSARTQREENDGHANG